MAKSLAVASPQLDGFVVFQSRRRDDVLRRVAGGWYDNICGIRADAEMLRQGKEKKISPNSYPTKKNHLKQLNILRFPKSAFKIELERVRLKAACNNTMLCVYVRVRISTCVALQFLHNLLCLQVPDVDHVVLGARDDPLRTSRVGKYLKIILFLSLSLF